ncbi:transglutaminaseTgpA domain-containing protein [Lentzea sp. NPDC034063]|uniref:transglutaminase TgpA family protein n=1 Tax=unclassified Lentzea TaxID=2643253 RepID=UPI0033FC7462
MNRLRALAPGIAVVEVALALVASGAAALVYQDFFATPGYLIPLGLACLAGGVTAAPRHRRAWATPLLAAAGLALVVVFGVFRGAGSEVLDGVPGSWNRLLAVAVPADPWGELLVVPTIVMWAAAFTSVVLVRYNRNALAPLAPPLVGFVFAVFVVGNQAGGHAAATAVFLVAALALIAIRAHRAAGTGAVRIDRRSPRSLTALSAAVLVVVVSALLGAAGGQVLPIASGDHRFDPRDLIAPPVTTTDALTPLARLKSQLRESPARDLFTVRLDVESYTQVDRIRTAALDEFDGTTWTSGATYRVAGSHLTADPALTRGRQVTAHIDLKDLSGPHLPVIGWPARLETTGGTRGRLGFDANSGVVVSSAPKLQGLGYDLTAEVTVRDDGLAQATTTPGHSRSLPEGLPTPLRVMAAEFTGLPGLTAYGKLVALETRLQAVTMSMTRPPGHSYATLAAMLSDEEKGSGYSEQHAAAFTVIARAMGFPARVAVGYRLRNYQGGVFRVNTADAHAWSEVHFAGYGWVAFEPSRPDYGAPPAEPQDAPRVVPPQAAPPATTPTPAPPTSSQSTEVVEGPGFGWNSVRDGTVLAAVAAVLLVLLACGFVVLVKSHRRRRRQRDPDRAARVLGAWQEQIDRLTERGITFPVSLTAPEVARRVHDDLGEAAPLFTASAELANAAVYAPETLDDADADQSWRLVTELREQLHSGRASLSRLRAAVDPRPLWSGWSTARQRRQARESLEVGRYR